MKLKLKRVIALAMLMSFCIATTVFGANATMLNSGYAFLNSGSSNGMKMVDSGTIRGNVNHYSSLKVTTTYTDGTEDVVNRSVSKSNSYYTSSWEWSEGYNSVHKLYDTVTHYYDSKEFSAD